MTDYVKTVDFAAKDALPLNDPGKYAKGTEVDNELDNIAIAIATKEDTGNKDVAGGYAGLDGSGLLDVGTIPTSIQRTNTGLITEVGFRAVPQNAITTNYTLVLGDSGKHILHASSAGAGHTITIPANSSVPFLIGTVITFINRDSNTVTIAIGGSDTLILQGTVSTGSRTLGVNSIATAIKTETTVWIISGVY